MTLTIVLVVSNTTSLNIIRLAAWRLQAGGWVWCLLCVLDVRGRALLLGLLPSSGGVLPLGLDLLRDGALLLVVLGRLLLGLAPHRASAGGRSCGTTLRVRERALWTLLPHVTSRHVTSCYVMSRHATWACLDVTWCDFKRCSHKSHGCPNLKLQL